MNKAEEDVQLLCRQKEVTALIKVEKERWALVLNAGASLKLVFSSSISGNGRELWFP